MPVNGPDDVVKVGDKARALDGLESAIASTVAEHPAFGRGLMQEIRKAVDATTLRALVSALGGEGRSFVPNAPSGDLRSTLRSAPEWLETKYRFENEMRTSGGYSKFDINPPPSSGGGLALESTHIDPNELGGLTVSAGPGAVFTGAEWSNGRPLRDYVTAGEARQLENEGFNLDHPTSVLVLRNSAESNPVVLAFDTGAPWERAKVACICTKVSVGTLDGGTEFVLEKPVVYFYPERKTDVSMRLELDGQLIAEYPKSESGAWSFIATPDGTLYEPKTERRFSYLFWEAKAARRFELDRAQAFCVKGSDSAAFLEKVAGRFGFNDRERTDFISYWIARLERNRYNVIQFLDDASYDRYAHMTIDPTPDSVIRLFMIYKGVGEAVDTGSPELPLRFRKGFTVVEWGGCEL